MQISASDFVHGSSANDDRGFHHKIPFETVRARAATRETLCPPQKRRLLHIAGFVRKLRPSAIWCGLVGKGPSAAAGFTGNVIYFLTFNMDDRIFRWMSRISNRDKILSEGLRVVHEQGFGGASVRDIVSAAGVPQGSFTNHFSSKEAFGLEILNLYFENARQIVGRTLQDESVAPLRRVRMFINEMKCGIEKNDMKTGCMLGNFSAEVTTCNGAIRKRLAEIFEELRATLDTCLKAAVKAGELPAEFKTTETAGFIISSLQGAILLSKAHREIAPMEQFEHILFSKVLT